MRLGVSHKGTDTTWMRRLFKNCQCEVWRDILMGMDEILCNGANFRPWVYSALTENNMNVGDFKSLIRPFILYRYVRTT